MSTIRLWPLERLTLNLFSETKPGPECWLCGSRSVQSPDKVTEFNFELEGRRSVLHKRVGTAEKLSDIEIVNLAHLAKPVVVFMSQLWSEFAVRERTVEGRIHQADIVGVRKKARLIQLAALHPKYLAYALQQPELEHIKAIRFPVQDGIFYVAKLPLEMIEQGATIRPKPGEGA